MITCLKFGKLSRPGPLKLGVIIKAPSYLDNYNQSSPSYMDLFTVLNLIESLKFHGNSSHILKIRQIT